MPSLISSFIQRIRSLITLACSRMATQKKIVSKGHEYLNVLDLSSSSASFIAAARILSASAKDTIPRADRERVEQRTKSRQTGKRGREQTTIGGKLSQQRFLNISSRASKTRSHSLS